MWIIAIAWMYVALMMALAEATSPQGTVLGAVITIIFYGLAPVALVMYLLGAPGRRRARLKAEAEANAQHLAQSAAQVSDGSTQTDASGLSASEAIAPVGKESGSV